jgi:hypothetical protein
MCTCIAQLTKTLREENTEFDFAHGWFNKSLRTRLQIRTKKIDSSKRKPAMSVMTSYCPFCGEKYPE